MRFIRYIQKDIVIGIIE